MTSPCEVRRYGDDLIVADFVAETAEEVRAIEAGDATDLWLNVPTDAALAAALRQEGFAFADRMMDVSIRVADAQTDYEKMVRIKPQLTGDYKEEIKAIAHESFPSDRRFHVRASLDQTLANRILDAWIDDLDEAYVCRYKEETAGFLALQKTDETHAVVHLAAVAARFRPAGVALSLYAHALNDCRKAGMKTVKGCVSSRNLSALNLFFHLGAKLERVRDIYVKEVRG